jgi:hypothetical protein
MNQHTDIKGWGVDADLADRPGVPAEMEPPRPLGNMSLGFPAQQSNGPSAVQSASRPLTPVYSTSLPPRGLSGVLRRAAYKIPDYKARRWLLLMLADRIDVIEHNVMPMTMVVGGLALGIVGIAGIRALARR